jgi:hypothetical protein
MTKKKKTFVADHLILPDRWYFLRFFHTTSEGDAADTCICVVVAAV